MSGPSTHLRKVCLSLACLIGAGALSLRVAVPVAPVSEADVAAAVAGGRPAGWSRQVRICRDAREAQRWHIVDLASDGAGANQIDLRHLEGTSVRTVSDAPGFAHQGGMVNLVAPDRRIRLGVNLEAVECTDLRMGPQVIPTMHVVTTVLFTPR